MLLKIYSNNIHCVLLKILNEAFNYILNLKERQLSFKIKVIGDWKKVLFKVELLHKRDGNSSTLRTNTSNTTGSWKRIAV